MAGNVAIIAEEVSLPDLHLHFHFDKSCNNCCRDCNCSGWNCFSCFRGATIKRNQFHLEGEDDVYERTANRVYRALVSRAGDVCEDNHVSRRHGRRFVAFCMYHEGMDPGSNDADSLLSQEEMRRLEDRLSKERIYWGVYNDLTRRIGRLNSKHLDQLKRTYTPKRSGMRKILTLSERRILRQTMKTPAGELAIRHLKAAKSIGGLLDKYDEGSVPQNIATVRTLARIVHELVSSDFPSPDYDL